MSSVRKGILSVAVIGLLIYGMLALTPIRGLSQWRDSPYSIPILDRNGAILRILPLEEGLRRIRIDSVDLSKESRKIILSSEDKRFYFHPGFDPPALVRSLYLWKKTGEIQSGGSTITMQVTRMIRKDDGGVGAKVIEVFDAFRLDARYGKSRIFNWYINNLPFGHNLEGLEAASLYYLQKGAKDLTAAETLILMMIPRNPTQFDPIKSSENNIQACLRTLPRCPISIKEEELRLVIQQIEEIKERNWDSNAPHFVRFIEQNMSDKVRKEGKPLYTTLDLDIQKNLSSAIALQVASAEKNRVTNGAGLFIKNNTGEILGYSGSVDFFSEINNGQIDGVQIKRQPGSTLKPFLYSLALEMGFLPSTVLPDIPLEFGSEEIYIPKNYNNRYNGPVIFPIALASSLNIPAVYLLERVGTTNFIDRLIKAGMESLEDQRGKLGVGLALGNAEISLYELVQAYRIFGQEGRFTPLTFLLNQKQTESREVFQARTNQTIRTILSNPENRILGFGRNHFLDRDYDFLIKTGTSNQFNNIWAVAVSEQYTCGIWMGNFSGETVIGTPGSSLPARAVMDVLDDYSEDSIFHNNIPWQKVKVCSLSGMKAGPHCTYTYEQYFYADSLPEPCTWHSPKGTSYPPEYRNWLKSMGMDESVSFEKKRLEIVTPQSGSIFYQDNSLPEESQSLLIEMEGESEGTLFLNGTPQFKGELPARIFLPLQKGEQELTLTNTEGDHDTIRFVVH
jgi:penicillin-binding protein 1C